MNDRHDERLLAYLEDRLSSADSEQLEREIAASPALAAELETARRGLEALRELAATPHAPAPPLAEDAWTRASAGAGSRVTRHPRTSPWLYAAAVAALLLLPASGWFARGWIATPAGDGGPPPIPGVVTPPVTNPQMQEYLLLFTGPWPDIETLSARERLERQEAYMSWFGALEAEGRLVAGGELGGDPGVFLTSAGMGVSEFELDLPPQEVIVGFVYIRAESPEEARRIAAECPHVRFGSGVLLKGPGGMPL